VPGEQRGHASEPIVLTRLRWLPVRPPSVRLERVRPADRGIPPVRLAGRETDPVRFEFERIPRGSPVSQGETAHAGFDTYLCSSVYTISSAARDMMSHR